MSRYFLLHLLEYFLLGTTPWELVSLNFARKRNTHRTDIPFFLSITPAARSADSDKFGVHRYSLTHLSVYQHLQRGDGSYEVGFAFRAWGLSTFYYPDHQSWSICCALESRRESIPNQTYGVGSSFRKFPTSYVWIGWCTMKLARTEITLSRLRPGDLESKKKL